MCPGLPNLYLIPKDLCKRQAVGQLANPLRVLMRISEGWHTQVISQDVFTAPDMSPEEGNRLLKGTARAKPLLA